MTVGDGVVTWVQMEQNLQISQGRGQLEDGKQPTLREGRARKKNLCESATSILYGGQVIVPGQDALLLCPIYLDHNRECD